MKNKMASSSREISEREAKNVAVLGKIAAQGIVLLKNNGILPFVGVKTVALFGSGARRTVKGGTGSSDVNVRGVVSVEEGLKKAGFQVITSSLLDEYDELVQRQYAAWDAEVREMARDNSFKGLVYMMSHQFQAPATPMLTEAVLERFPAEAAIYVLSRSSGEGADRQLKAGDYYLTEQEISDISLLAKNYEKFILLLNIGSVIELAPVQKLPGAIVLMGQGGSSCGDAVASVLTGVVTPSGKLTSTWANTYGDYPYGGEFAGLNGDMADSYYREGIYVGYRYFDTFDVEPLYPFGYGLSYTEFAISALSAELTGSTMRIRIVVQNTGSIHTGREVVQCYISQPPSGIDKPLQSLAAFIKTKELAPGESEVRTLSFDLASQAVYDERRAAWVLEKGEYIVRCGNHSRNTRVIAAISVSEDVITQQCKNLLRSAHVEQLTPFNSRTEKHDDVPHLTLDCHAINTIEHNYSNLPVGNEVDKLTSEELALLCVGASRLNLADTTVVGTFADSLPGAAGDTTPLLKEKGIPSITMVDGPSGIRVNPIVHEKDGMYISVPKEDPILSHILIGAEADVNLSGTVTKYQYCTALPTATMLAQSWDLELIEQAGQLVGEEMAEIGVDLWLAPALNIQRNPLCGRNFEYYSEDPLLSGLCAAAMTRGVQSVSRKGVCIKHLAANNQETNRNFNNSHVSERALREIYLKGFETCVRIAQPYSAMTSVNLINGVHAAADRDMLTYILRCEWGFDGAVMTDWGTTGEPGSVKGQKYDCTYAPDCIRAGNDLIMPGAQRDIDYIIQSVECGELDLVELKRCAANVLRLIRRVSE